MRLRQRDLAEIARSAAEAGKADLASHAAANIDRYRRPDRQTAFGLEYAFHLLGDVCGKKVLDLGCGSGENVIPLLKRGARVIGLDISPELIEMARNRVAAAGMAADLRVGSAYETGLPDRSIDTVFCMSLAHHLDIPVAREEMRRVLAARGQIVFKEPIRFSHSYSRIRSWLPSFGDVSEYEHPLTRDEFASLTKGFLVQGLRYFRLPFVPLARLLKIKSCMPWRISNWCLRNFSALEVYATSAVGRMVEMRPVDIRPGFQTEYGKPVVTAACAQL